MVYRNEYPRPNFVRTEWLSLNGEWDFAFDDENVGQKEKWFLNHVFDKKIVVPFAYQTKLSGINDTSFHDYVWYKKTFAIPDSWKNKNILLNFGAIDFEATIYVNGCFVAHHIGGNTPIKIDITDYLNYQEETVVVYVFDPSEDIYIPRGKQYWKEQEESIYYNRTTGIWQSVFIEPVDKVYLKTLKITTDIDNKSVVFEGRISIYKSQNISISIYDNGVKIAYVEDSTLDDLFNVKCQLNFANEGEYLKKLWSVSNPYLFDVKIQIKDLNDNLTDEVNSYFGLRKIEVKNQKVYLNNVPFYQKLILDQGYWRDSLLTAPSDEDYVKDINLSKNMGFNGCRKHQKAEDPRFLYWADKLGYVVWGEMSNALDYSDRTVRLLIDEWHEIIERDYSHPCIVAWVPLNESWGVRQIGIDKKQQSHSLSLYHLVKSLDQTRCVISNDGWEHTKSDILTIHSYVHGNNEEFEKYQTFIKSLSSTKDLLTFQPAKRIIYAEGYKYDDVPIYLSEFGGISLEKGLSKGWGYTSSIDEEDFINSLKRVFYAVKVSPVLSGFCYTQFSDVEQEINGLLTYDRTPKIPLAIIKRMLDEITFKK